MNTFEKKKKDRVANSHASGVTLTHSASISQSHSSTKKSHAKLDILLLYFVLYYYKQVQALNY